MRWQNLLMLAQPAVGTTALDFHPLVITLVAGMAKSTDKATLLIIYTLIDLHQIISAFLVFQQRMVVLKI